MFSNFKERVTFKYFKPFSLTWWSALCPLLIGVFLATEDLHGWTAMVNTVNALAGDPIPFNWINAGLAGIGLRGAV